MKTCIHCLTAFTSKNEEEQFCCAGCEYVHHLITESGYDMFYQLREGKTLIPAQNRPFEQSDFSWLPPIIATVEEGAVKHTSLTLSVEGVTCVGCVWLMETLFMKMPGAVRAVANPTRGTLLLEWIPQQCDVQKFLEQIHQYGYRTAPYTSQSKNKDFREIMIRMGLCAAFMLNTMAFMLPFYFGMKQDAPYADLFLLIAFFSATLSMLVGASWFIKKAYYALKMGQLHMDAPISLGLLLAYAGSLFGWLTHHLDLIYFDFVSTFVFLMLLGRMVQNRAVEKNRNVLLEQQAIAEDYDTEDGGKISLTEIKAASVFHLKSGQVCPVSAMPIKSAGVFSLEWINGEADPVCYQVGTRLPSGAILVGTDALALRAEETWSESLLSKLTQRTVEDKKHAFLDRLLRWWIVIVMLIGLSVFAWNAWHHEVLLGVQKMISIFVVSCPCALGLAIPLANEIAANGMQRIGVFLRNHTLWSRLAKVRHIVFDKTGTLTMSRPQLQNPEVLSLLDDEAFASLTLLTHHSLHPVSRSLLEALGVRGQRVIAEQVAVTKINEVAGQGVYARINGHDWFLGKNENSPLTVLQKNQQIIAEFSFLEMPRTSAKQALEYLHGKHFRLHILSGDSQMKVNALSESLGIKFDTQLGGLSPEQKAEQMIKIGSQTLYMGDGANDSLAFDEAMVTGTPITDRSLLETKADFFTMGSGLTYFPSLFAIAYARSHAVRNAFAFALIYNVAVISLAIHGAMKPWIAAIIMPLSSLVSIAIVAYGLRSNRKNNVAQRR